jgi:hypothetical protein
MVIRFFLAVVVWAVAVGCAALTGMLYSEAKYLVRTKEYTHGRLNGLMSVTMGLSTIFLLLAGLAIVKAI